MMSANLPLSPTARTRKAKRLRDKIVIGGFLLLFGIGLFGLTTATGWADTWAQLGRLSLWQCGILLGLSLVNYGLRGLRWHLFARSLGAPTGLWRNFVHFFGGFAMIVTPGRLGELVRVRWLARDAGWHIDKAAPLALMDRASDLASVALLLGLAVSLAHVAIRGAFAVSALSLAAAGAATHPGLMAWLITWTYRVTGRLPRLFARARISARSLAAFSGPRVLLPTLLLGLVGWAAEGYAFERLLSWFGTDIGFAAALSIFLFSALAGGMTGAPGGVGGAEAAMIALLALEGVPLQIAIAATAIIRVTTLWFAVGLGVLTFPIAERLSCKGVK